MVELSTYGSGEGAGWVTGRRYSTPLGRSMKHQRNDDCNSGIQVFHVFLNSELTWSFVRFAYRPAHGLVPCSFSLAVRFDLVFLTPRSKRLLCFAVFVIVPFFEQINLLQKRFISGICFSP
jgi:hypothetical protein